MSHYLGVTWLQQSNMWQASFRQHNGMSKIIGSYEDEVAAAHAYDAYALEQQGPGAVRNAMPSYYTGGHVPACVCACMCVCVTAVVVHSLTDQPFQ